MSLILPNTINLIYPIVSPDRSGLFLYQILKKSHSTERSCYPNVNVISKILNKVVESFEMGRVKIILSEVVFVRCIMTSFNQLQMELLSQLIQLFCLFCIKMLMDSYNFNFLCKFADVTQCLNLKMAQKCF